MSKTWTIARRELTSLFYSPIAYVALAIFAFLTSLFFVWLFGPAQDASLRGEFLSLVFLLVFIVPAISMRMLSEEFQSGTIELLTTSPINDTQIVLGKWLGSFVFFAVLLSPVLVHLIVLEMYADPDLGPAVTGAFGLLLVGGLYLAVGAMVSASSPNVVVSYLVTALITGTLTIGMSWLSAATTLPPWLAWSRSVAGYINVNSQFENFARGLIDIRNLLYFVSGIGLFLYAAIKLLESRRWR